MAWRGRPEKITVPEEKFETNVLRMIAALSWSSLLLQASRDLFGKGYYSLAATEKQAVDQAVFAQLSANFQAITPDLLGATPVANRAGFQGPSEKGQQSS